VSDQEGKKVRGVKSRVRSQKNRDSKRGGGAGRRVDNRTTEVLFLFIFTLYFRECWMIEERKRPRKKKKKKEEKRSS